MLPTFQQFRQLGDIRRDLARFPIT